MHARGPVPQNDLSGTYPQNSIPAEKRNPDSCQAGQVGILGTRRRQLFILDRFIVFRIVAADVLAVASFVG